MALTLQNTGLTGIYQGQGGNPVTIGSVAGRPDNDVNSPFVCGCYLGPDSIQMNAFFDPTVSPILNSALLDPNRSYDRIGIIQTGNFRINHLYLPHNFYQADSLYPDTVKYISMHGATYPGATEWIDTPWEKSNGDINRDPTFPAWNYADSARTSQKSLFQYPNTYGGFVRYRPQHPYPYRNGENLCAYINSNLVIDSGNSPDFPMVLDLKDFLDAIDPTEYVLEDTKISIVNFQNNPAQVKDVVDQLNRLGIIPFNFNNAFIVPESNNQSGLGTYSTFTNTKIRFVLSATRLYIQYSTSKMFPTEDDPFERIVLMPVGQTFHYFNYNEDFEDDFTEAKKDSAPDVPRIFKQIQDKYGFTTSQPDRFILTYQMYTCACIIKPDFLTQRVDIQLLEGFMWDISNYYTVSEGWGNFQLTQSPSSTNWLCRVRRSSLKFVLGNYYRKLSENERFQVNFL